MPKAHRCQIGMKYKANHIIITGKVAAILKDLYASCISL